MPRQLAKRSSSEELAQLLQSLFAAELIAPSRDFWIVSPWISDIPLLDNRDGSFQHLEPTWPTSTVRLSQVLGKLVGLGTNLRIACRPDERNLEFINNLDSTTEGSRTQLSIFRSNDLHEKGILGDSFYLSGSMNLTYYGLTVNEEALQLHTDLEFIAEKRLHLASRWSLEGE